MLGATIAEFLQCRLATGCIDTGASAKTGCRAEALMETNAKSLVDHWTWAANKGVMNPNTAAGLRAACTQILAVVGEGWEDTDVATLDVENLLIRFQNLRK